MESYNSFNVAQNPVIEAAKLLNVDKLTIDLLKWPQKRLEGSVPNMSAVSVIFNDITTRRP